jgi:hypothetical protein
MTTANIATVNMTTARKFLIFFHGLTSFMQFGLGAWILFGLNSLLNAEHMTYSSDLKVFSTYFGVCLFIIASIGVIAISFNRQDKPEGLVLSKFIGWCLLIAGVIVVLEIGRWDLAAVDFIRGGLILVSAYLVKDK